MSKWEQVCLFVAILLACVTLPALCIALATSVDLLLAGTAKLVRAVRCRWKGIQGNCLGKP